MAPGKSFGELLDEGHSRAYLSEHFCLTENEFDRVLLSLQNIRAGVRR